MKRLVNMKKSKCEYHNGISIKPDGRSELDPCIYDVVEVHKNVDVEVSRCRKCGHIEVNWIRRDDTIDDVFDNIDWGG